MRKAQAAMEFLMTYGWAILVVLIAIGALAYFGVLNPSRFLPESCTLVAGLSCDDFEIDSTANTVTIIVRNGAGDSITIDPTNQPGLDTDGDGASECTFISSTLDPLPDGNTATWVIGNCVPAITPGSRFRGDLEGAYTKGTSTIAHQLSGSVVGRTP